MGDEEGALEGPAAAGSMGDVEGGGGEGGGGEGGGGEGMTKHGQEAQMTRWSASERNPFGLGKELKTRRPSDHPGSMQPLTAFFQDPFTMSSERSSCSAAYMHSSRFWIAHNPSRAQSVLPTSTRW